MALPGFGADASLGRAFGVYRGAAAGGRVAGAVTLQANAGLGPIGGRWPVMRCCGWFPLLGRFVCVSRVRVPWEQCTCQRTPYGPVITCEPIVLTPDVE